MIEASIALLFGTLITLIVVEITLMTVKKRIGRKRTWLTQLKTTGETVNLESLAAVVQELQFGKEDLKRVLRKYKREPTRKSGLTLLLFGVIFLVSSIVFTSNILALLGLGLTFWGTLFLLIRPVTYVKSSLVDSSIMPSLVILDEMLTQLNYQGNATYLPPRSLKGAKKGTLFIAAKKESVMPAIEDIPQGKVFINPDGMCLIPLGQGLVNLFEEELGTNLFRTDFYFLQRNLPRLFIEDFELAEDFEMDVNGDVVHVRMKGSVYSNVCNEVRKLTNICSRVGCPLCSAIAYALAKATGKAVTIEKNEFHENDTIEIWYRLFNVS